MNFYSILLLLQRKGHGREIDCPDGGQENKVAHSESKYIMYDDL